MSSVVSSVRVWADMVKLPHSVFALPFALMAAFLAGRRIEGRDWPHAGQLALIIVCMVAARSVAMTFNRIVDCAIDARNPRTASRPLPAGRLTPPAAWVMLGLSGMTFGAACLGFAVFFDNTWPMLLSGPVLLFLCAYSLTKRFTKWSHYCLGTALGLSPPAAWLAVDPASIGWPVVVLAGVVVCWVAGFDIIYACQDIEVDRRDRLHSLPARLGPKAALWIARASHLAAVIGLMALGRLAGLGWIFGGGIALAAVLLLVENLLVRPGDYRHVGVAFFTLNGLVSLVLAGAAIADLWFSRSQMTV
ncbi:MAG: UbiA-like polyprenyltransferase [Phycisphaerae bacterium]